MKIFVSFVVGLLAASAGAGEAAAPFTAPAYAQLSGSRGVVLVSANWGPRWKCGKYENAQLASLSFDKSGSSRDGNDAKADLVLEHASVLPATARFVNYAYIVEPGEYLLSAYSVKVARSLSDVGYLKAARSDLIADGRSRAGSFSVSAGEIVYIGHFFLDCAQEPMPWRYHTSDRGDFTRYLAGVKKAFEPLDIEKVEFRLFDTTTMGNAFSLR